VNSLPTTAFIPSAIREFLNEIKIEFYACCQKDENY